MFIYICIFIFSCHVNSDDLSTSNIHLNIEYPNNNESSKLKLQTGGGGDLDNSSIKTPTVIISPKYVVDYDRLYKKLMTKSHEDKFEKNVVYDEKLAYSDPVSRRELLLQLLKDVESRLAFYRADANEMEMMSSAL